MTDWELCFICQQDKDENLRSNETGLETLATNIPKFEKHGKLKFDLNRVQDGSTDLFTLLKGRAKYYHNCAQTYSN